VAQAGAGTNSRLLVAGDVVVGATTGLVSASLRDGRQGWTITGDGQRIVRGVESRADRVLDAALKVVDCVACQPIEGLAAYGRQRLARSGLTRQDLEQFALAPPASRAPPPEDPPMRSLRLTDGPPGSSSPSCASQSRFGCDTTDRPASRYQHFGDNFSFASIV